ncbi:ATPase P [Candidatus Nitrosymbiomonas proteolyticus]|uniref:ATPase P n=1 Tax=Candidatus Nitrosymbiomonas proteolyticus TaxID=2608984 RepID=A0A809S3K7_9BACT|nr:ATPase P [Candidatus Nitrosymbiomonas proteolyticus]
MKTVFRIGKMDCPTEEGIIRNRLNGMNGIERLEFDLMSRKLTVIHDHPDESTIQQALESVGMDPKLVSEDEPESAGHGPAVPILDRWLMGASGVLAVAAEVIAWTMGTERSWPVIALALGSIALGGKETIRKGIVSLRTLTLNINFLMTIAIIGAAFIGQWPEAAMVTFLFGVAEMIEAFSLDRARHAIRSLMELSPERALALVGNEWVEIEASSVALGQLVRVRPGERIALDGLVKKGSSSVNQAPITGESIPVAKAAGDQVFAGTINEKGSFDFEVTANTGQTTLARIIRAVQQAQSQKAPTQRFVDQFARYYTPLVVVLAILITVVPPLLLAQPYSDWLYKALVLLVIACPCALVISTPVTVVSALASAARRGILIKGGVYIEEGRRLSRIALDKTGTLTHGLPKVTDVIPFDSIEEVELLRLAASLDAPSEHPVATAIVDAYKGERASVQEFESITGRGVSGVVDGQQYFLGNHRLAHEEDYCRAEVEAVLEDLEEQGKTVVILGNADRALGVIAVADTVRETSIQAVKELHDLGVRTLMLTGDNARTANAIAAQVGIDDARGDLLPEDKRKIITELTADEEHVGMVGDGINDAPALAQADVGFAMGAAGTDTAIETADVALMQDDLRKIPEFIRLSRRASTVLKQNIAFAIGVKVLFFVLAFLGIATLWMAVFADMGASLLVVVNGLRLLQSPIGSSFRNRS